MYLRKLLYVCFRKKKDIFEVKVRKKVIYHNVKRLTRNFFKCIYVASQFI